MKKSVLIGSLICLFILGGGGINEVDAQNVKNIRGNYFEKYSKISMMLNPVQIKIQNRDIIARIDIANGMKKRNFYGFKITLRFNEDYIRFDRIDDSKRIDFRRMSKEDKEDYYRSIRKSYGSDNSGEITFKYNMPHPGYRNYEPHLIINNGTILNLVFKREHRNIQDSEVLKIEFKSIDLYYSSSRRDDLSYSDPTKEPSKLEPWLKPPWEQRRHEKLLVFNSWVVEKRLDGDINMDGSVNGTDMVKFYSHLLGSHSRFRNLDRGKFLNLSGAYSNRQNIHILRLMDLNSNWIIGKADEEKLRLKVFSRMDVHAGAPSLLNQPLAVHLSSFYSKRTSNNAVIITWSTESELDNAGFNILRSTSRSGKFERINDRLIPGAGTTEEKTEYIWMDSSAKPNTLYYYQIEEISLSGDHRTLRTIRLSGYIESKNKTTTTWASLKSKE